MLMSTDRAGCLYFLLPYRNYMHVWMCLDLKN